MIDSLTYLYYAYTLAIIIHLVSFAIQVFFVLRLAFREATVKNGLRPMRVALMIGHTTIAIIHVISIVVLTSRFFISDPDVARYFIASLILAHSMGLLTSSLNSWSVLRMSFSDENKKHHRMIATIEEKEAKKKGI